MSTLYYRFFSDRVLAPDRVLDLAIPATTIHDHVLGLGLVRDPVLGLRDPDHVLGRDPVLDLGRETDPSKAAVAAAAKASASKAGEKAVRMAVSMAVSMAGRKAEHGGGPGPDPALRDLQERPRRKNKG